MNISANNEFALGGARLRIASVVDDSIVDGPGLRMTVFTQGCHHHCRGCQNPATHNPHGGHFESLQNLLDRYAENPLLSGVTFSGGEPFLQARALAWLATKVRELGGDVVTYTGYCFEDLAFGKASRLPGARELLAATDLLVDGPYIEDLRSLELLYRGSSNQRLLDRAERDRLLLSFPFAMSA